MRKQVHEVALMAKDKEMDDNVISVVIIMMLVEDKKFMFLILYKYVVS